MIAEAADQSVWPDPVRWEPGELLGLDVGCLVKTSRGDSFVVDAKQSRNGEQYACGQSADGSHCMVLVSEVDVVWRPRRPGYHRSVSYDLSEPTDRRATLESVGKSSLEERTRKAVLSLQQQKRVPLDRPRLRLKQRLAVLDAIETAERHDPELREWLADALGLGGR